MTTWIHLHLDALLAGLRARLTALAQRLATIDTKVADGQKGWSRLSSRPNDRDAGEMLELYRNALEATRRNPLAKSLIDITTDFVIGDGIDLSSHIPRIQRFIGKFWNHPLNRIDQRIQAMSDELSRAGDLFVLLFRNPEDGMSYVRFVTKEQITEIETAENDWETEIAYHQATDVIDIQEPIVWLSPQHPQASEQDAVMLHYSINRPIGATFGDGDLDTIVPWLLKYSRMLEDRVRMHWAIRSFLWFVTVPTSKVESKKQEYGTPPEAGSIIVKDDAEEWDVKTPTLRAADARHDMQAVRHMIDAVGYPPHWRGEGGDANLATATAMQLRPERHLRRRQNYIVFMLEDLIYNAYVRAHELGKVRGRPPEGAYDDIFSANVADISRADNEMLSLAAKNITDTFTALFEKIQPQQSPTLARLALRLIFKFAGEPQTDPVLDEIMAQAGIAELPVEEESVAEQRSADQPSSNGHKVNEWMNQ